MTTPRGTAEVGRPDAATISKVRRSCASVSDRPVQLAEAFYEELFELAPSVRGMFAEDMSLQHERMCRVLLQAVTMADQDPVAVEVMLQKMGAQHARHFDVVPEHYPFVGRALVRAVRSLSGDWSTEIGSAWIQVYEWLAAHMVLGARIGGELVAAPRPTSLRNATTPRAARAAVRHTASAYAPAPREPEAARVTGVSVPPRQPGRASRLLQRRHRQASPDRTAASTYGLHAE